MNRWRADVALGMAALIWGFAFVAQKEAEALVPPVSFVAARFAISVVALAPFAVYEARTAQPLDKCSWRLALGVALTLFVGSVLQQVGLATTSATNGGFLTACYVVLTPIAVWITTARAPRPIVAIAAGLSIVGAWLLASGGGPAKAMSAGDGLILLSDLAWAFGIAWMPMFLARTRRPFTLAFLQYAVCAALAALVATAYETVRVADFIGALWPLLFAGLVSGAFGFTLQILGQRHTPPSEAALLLSLESVFAAIAGALWLDERLTTVGMLGCALILISVLLVEVGPTFLRRVRLAAWGAQTGL